MASLAVSLAVLFALAACGGSTEAAPVAWRPPPATQTAPLRLVALGDVLLGHDALPWMEQEGLAYSLRGVPDAATAEDLVVANLEGPLTTWHRPIDPDKPFLLQSAPAAAFTLREYGVDLVSLANNHTMDYGRVGLEDCVQALGAAGLASFGAGHSSEEAAAGVIVEQAGLRIGFVGFCEPFEGYDALGFFATRWRAGVARLDTRTVEPALAALRPRVDLLVVVVHWGAQYLGVTPLQRDWARRFVDGGADLVLGHHPHIAQGVGLDRGVPIVYSLGNFAFGVTGAHHRLGPVKRHGWVAEVTVEEGRVRRVDLRPVLVDNLATAFQPSWGAPDVLAPMAQALQPGVGPPLVVLEEQGRLRLDIPPR